MNSRTNKKIVKLRMKMGWEGFGLYWALIELIYEAGGHLDNVPEEISFALGIDKKTCEKFLNYCFEYKLVKKKQKKITHKKILSQLKFREKLSKAGRKGGQKSRRKPVSSDKPGLSHPSSQAKARSKPPRKQERRGEDRIEEDLSKEREKSPAYGNEDINYLVKHFTEALGTQLDDSVKSNRRFCNLLIEKIRKEYPDKDPVEGIKIVIDLGLQDKFHGKNLTGFKYLYYNFQKIVRTVNTKKNLIVKL